MSGTAVALFLNEGDVAPGLSKGAHRGPVERLNFSGGKRMLKTGKTATERILENIIFLADVFGEQLEKDIPGWPVLEMARCFELAR